LGKVSKLNGLREEERLKVNTTESSENRSGKGKGVKSHRQDLWKRERRKDDPSIVWNVAAGKKNRERKVGEG